MSSLWLLDAALPDHLEGTLDGSLRSAVEGHLRECVRCTGLVRDLRGIEAESAKLPDLVPSRDLWQGIETRIAAPVIPLARSLARKSANARVASRPKRASCCVRLRGKKILKPKKSSPTTACFNGRPADWAWRKASMTS